MKTTKLWLRNTSRYSDAEVWPLVKAAYESVARSVAPGQQMPRIIVKLTNCRGSFRGRAHWIEWEHKEPNHVWGEKVMWHRVLVRIGAPDKFPRHIRYPRYKTDMPEYDCNSYREGIVMVAAHEMEHCLGADGNKAGEFRCEMASWDAIEYFRKHQAEIEAEIAQATNAIAKREQAVVARKALGKSPEIVLAKKLAQAEQMQAKWTRKLKLALNKVKKYRRSAKRYQRKLAELNSQPLAMAAKPTPFVEDYDTSKAGVGDDE